MKKILIVLLFMTLKSMSYGQTNVYHKFPSTMASWSGIFSGYQSPGCYKFNYSLNYEDYNNGDSLYHLIQFVKTIFPNYGPGPNYGMCDFTGSGSSNWDYVGAIREDTILRRVYFLPMDSIHERLLYDFSLNVGDTLKSYLNTYCQHPTVTEIDSILINGDYRKRWTFNDGGCLWNGQIIEGIGSTMGLLIPFVNFEWGGYLTCFSEENVNIYSQDNTTCPLPLITGINNSKKQYSNLTISPNPAKNSITISQTEPMFNKYEIYSMNGKLVTESKINGILQKVDLTGYTEGMYIVKLIGTQKVEFKKIVVSE